MAELRFHLRGSIDLSNAPDVREELVTAVNRDGSHLLVDCADLTFIDSSGLRVLLATHRDLEADGRHMLIVNVPERCRRAFAILGLDDLFRYGREDGDRRPR